MGYLRLTLALLIMVAHLGPVDVLRFAPHLSVLAFYGLAGYTATASMAGPYRGRPWPFMASRLLRLWPSYAVVFVLSLGWLWWVGPWQAIGYTSLWRAVPEALMLNQAGVPSPVPTGWVLPWFILGYLAIALGVVATPSRASLVLVAVVLLAQWVSFTASFSAYYYSPIFAALGGATGAAAYHLGVKLPRDRSRAAMAGALSYPVFLSHYLVGAVVATAYGLPHGWPLFFAALGPTMVLSWLLVVVVERPVQKFRSSLRNKTNVSF